MRSVAALAVGCNQQPFLAQRETMDRIHVVRVDAGQTLLVGHGAVAVALAASPWNIERVDSGAAVGLGKDFMRIAMATCAGMIL